MEQCAALSRNALPGSEKTLFFADLINFVIVFDDLAGGHIDFHYLFCAIGLNFIFHFNNRAGIGG